MDTLVRLLQLLNVCLPILVTLFGMIILVKLLHPRNAESSMVVTLFGIVILVILVQSRNASVPILVTGRPKVEGIIKLPLTALSQRKTVHSPYAE